MAGNTISRYERGFLPVIPKYVELAIRTLVAESREPKRKGTDGVPRIQWTRNSLGLPNKKEPAMSTQLSNGKVPILLGFPDGKLGDYVGDRALIYRVTQRIAEELGRLRPDAVITWGPDGGTGHPDHRIVSNIVTQLQRAGASECRNASST